MKEGIKLVVTALVLLIIALAVLTIYSDNLLDFLDHITETDDQSSYKISSTWYKIRHIEKYYLVDKTGFGPCTNSNCNPDIKTDDTNCNPAADQTHPTDPTCCCMRE